MARKLITVALLSMGVVCASPAFADTNKVTAAGQSAEVGDPDRKICKKITITGTRLGAEKICKSARQWAELQRESREAVQRRQKVMWDDEGPSAPRRSTF